MRCEKPSGSSAALLLVLFLFMALVMLRADEVPSGIMPLSSPESSGNYLSPGMPWIDPWESFDQLWVNLKDELTASELDWQKLQDSLARLQTETGELRSLLMESSERLARSEEARMIERKTAEAKIVDAILRSIEAEKKADRWRTGTFVAVVVGAVGWVGLSLSLIF